MTHFDLVLDIGTVPFVEETTAQWIRRRLRGVGPKGRCYVNDQPVRLSPGIHVNHPGRAEIDLNLLGRARTFTITGLKVTVTADDVPPRTLFYPVKEA